MNPTKLIGSDSRRRRAITSDNVPSQTLSRGIVSPLSPSREAVHEAYCSDLTLRHGKPSFAQALG